ncbi:hypothetical protein ABZ234_01765 [Nocardiopsis sp. NPDC006198]|uniref:hypothetical protein n=1 Tax=Nocardiopsis sp. NPDC006198 TaxID=3154472 RepID=UPI0033BF67B8
MVVIYDVQVGVSGSPHHLTPSLSPLVLQAVLAAAFLVFEGWLWHGASGLLADATVEGGPSGAQRR